MTGPVASLGYLTLKGVGLSPRSVYDFFKSVHSPLVVMIAMIYYLPLAWRKLILDACRIQAPILQNRFLSIGYYALSTRYINLPLLDNTNLIELDVEHVFTIVDCITPYPILSSMLSYFVRAECSYHIKEFQDQKLISFDKEICAAIDYSQDDQILEYRSLLFNLEQMNLHPQYQLAGHDIPVKLVSRWRKGMALMKSRLSNYRSLPLFPQYNTAKNIGYETTENLLLSLYGEAYEVTSLDRMQTTTLSLLRHYYSTGEIIPGPLECRQAWFFNDLKPRTYYCLGGDAFFAGLYIQHLANLIATFLPSTDPLTRFDVTRIHAVHDEREVLVTYDYSSFTTSLSELKFFLFWLGESLKGTPVTVLDVRHGLRTLDLGDMIQEYNRLVNEHQVFTTERFFPLLERAKVLKRQGRSGSLGVKGNIVFSMINHGIALASATGTPDEDSCVGDDALANILISHISLFISAVNNLGSINPTKFTIIHHHPEDQGLAVFDQFKYLKRPLGLDIFGKVTLGVLDFFPDIAGILFPDGDGIHSSKSIQRHHVDGVKTFVMQLGRFLRLQFNSREENDLVTEEDNEVLLGLFRMVYRRLGLPEAGAPPSTHFVPVPGEGSARMDLMIPPLSENLFEVRWEESLLEPYRGAIFSSPIWVGGDYSPPVDMEPGDRFRSTPSRLLVLLEDLGVLSSTVITEDVIFDEEYLERYRARLYDAEGAKDFHLLKNYVVVGSVPFWYLDMASHYQPDILHYSPMNAMSRITSLSGSTIS